MNIKPPGKAGYGAGEGERPQSMADDRDADGPSRGSVFACRAQLPAEPADLVRERDEHGDHRADRRLGEIRCLRH